MADIFDYLASRPYPGRGILLGKTPGGIGLSAYFIMGRSGNSRNRVFERTDDGIRTRAFDEAKMTDPSLIIYRPVRRCADTLIVTNGDQTDTIWEHLKNGGTLFSALGTRTFEPDAPNYTPRISGIVAPGGDYTLSILKAGDGDPSRCERFFYSYAAKAGVGHFISTYEGFGSPLPSFSGEPVSVELPDFPSAEALAERLWQSLDSENKVSLYAELGGESVIINKNS